MKREIATPIASPISTPADSNWWFGVARKWWVLIAVGTGSFMAGLDGSVVNTVLPVIRQAFSSDLATVEWVVMIYLLTLSVLLLSFGRLGDILGHKRVFNLGFVVFILGSALCGVAPTEGFLIGFRVLQAIGAAMLTANSPAIITTAFPAEQRGQALGMQATIIYLGVTAGPSLGGFLTDRFGWRAVFFINVPVGILGTILAFLIIPRTVAAQRRETFDLVGAGTFLVGLGALMLAVSKGQDMGWAAPMILGLFAVAVVFLAAFIRLEFSVSHPMLDLTLFRSRLLSAATSAAFFNYVCVYLMMFLMPFYLIQGRHFSPGFVGLLLTAQPIVMAIAAPFSGTLSDRIGSRIPATLGMVFLAVGLFGMSQINAQTSEMDIVIRLMLMGLGTGIFTSPNSSAILGSVPPQQRGIVSGIAATARNLGMIFGVAVAGAVFTTQIAVRTAALADQQAAFFGAISDTFLVAGVLAIIGILLSLVRGGAKPDAKQQAGKPV